MTIMYSVTKGLECNILTLGESIGADEEQKFGL